MLNLFCRLGPARRWLVPALTASLAAGPAVAGTLTVLHPFTAGADGATPQAGVIRDSAGNLYGENFYGADQCPAPSAGYGCGVIYKIDSAGNFTVLTTFNGSNGANGAAQLTLVGSRLYGSAAASSSPTYGLLFSLNTDGSDFMILHQFSGPDGIAPQNPLRVLANGTIYGVTVEGGGNYQPPALMGDGVLFKLTPSGTYSILHSFTGGADGFEPGAILVAANGTIYGTTGDTGRTNNGGSIYSYVPSTGVFSTLHTFVLGTGAGPQLGAFGPGGTIYGTMTGGGGKKNGTLFQVGENDGVPFIKTLWTFSGGADGGSPQPPVLAADGTIEGATSVGGSNGGGTLYSFAGGILTTLYSFSSSGTSTPWAPIGSLTIGSGAALYGTTLYSGNGGDPCIFPNHSSDSQGCGDVFSYTP